MVIYQVIRNKDPNSNRPYKIYSVNVPFEEGRKIMADQINNEFDTRLKSIYLSLYLPYLDENESASYYEYLMKLTKEIEKVEAKNEKLVEANYDSR